MTDITTDTRHEHARARLEAGLAAAWLRRVGPSGDPGDWHGMEILEVLDDAVELNLTPYATKGNVGSTTFVGDADATHGWRWHFRFYVDEDEPMSDVDRQLDRLDDEHGCWEDRGFSFTYEDQDPKAKPEVPDSVVKALVLLESDANG